MLIQTNPNGIEITSFVRGDLVPAMAGGVELCTGLFHDDEFMNWKKDNRTSYVAALVPNMKGLENLLKFSHLIDTAVVLVSCTDSHSKANVNRPLKEALRNTLEIVRTAKEEGLRIRSYASMAFGCPFEGAVPEKQVLDICNEYFNAGADDVILADTLGVGSPQQVNSFINKLITEVKIPLRQLGLHLHDSHGKAHLNVAEAWKLGLRDFDAAIGGCGGCNFAPGSKGNISTEKLIRAIALVDKSKGTHFLNMGAVRKANVLLGELIHRRLETEDDI